VREEGGGRKKEEEGGREEAFNGHVGGGWAVVPVLLEEVHEGG
jgi:hypothetical protein